MPKVKSAPDLKSLREKLNYNPETGIFTWKINVASGTIKAGTVAGKPRKDNGLRIFYFEGRSHQCARLAWYYVHGVWPDSVVFHLNGDSSDDRIENLKLSSAERNKRRKDRVTQKHLKEILHYEPSTGEFTWKIEAKKGQVQAGSKTCSRYISIDGIRYGRHWLAWFYVHGRWPEHLIDHINGDPRDNRIANLRPATCSQNAKNRRMSSLNKKSRVKGVHWRKERQTWVARISANGRKIHVGTFATISEAAAAYRAAAIKYHGEFACCDR